ncbi:serine/threonine protein kinase [Leucothrix pacifica]|uniref:Stress response kinase A n=1 Tax=Leucothrix pacifica TaxID=1247513 RepID=A0A317CMY1_9GAMM|nr:serine/threonine protein kinase [Leucothrix pacifica]PWQ99896.1 serine/threonine protein kinase [Leucothrix pacifica]
MNILEPAASEPEISAFQNLSPDEILDAVESQGYFCSGSFQALNSYENRVYQLGIEDGAPLIAKFYRPARWDNESIQEEHDFTRELVDSELPVVAPLYNAQGESIHQHGEFRFSLYPRVSGRTPELDNPDQLEVIGRFLARIHLHGEQADFKHRPAVDIESYGAAPSQYLLSEGKLPAGMEVAYRNLIDDLLVKINDHFSAAGSVQQLRIHGDCHPGNILYWDEVPHIVDFDDARMGPAIQDLWMYLSGERPYQQARLMDILIGYTQFRDFNPKELHLVEALRTLRMIHYAGWLAKRAEDPAFQLAFPWFYTARYWDDHILALKEQSALLDEEPLIWD